MNALALMLLIGLGGIVLVMLIEWLLLRAGDDDDD
jgi:hypothetical protein